MEEILIWTIIHISEWYEESPEISTVQPQQRGSGGRVRSHEFDAVLG